MNPNDNDGTYSNPLPTKTPSLTVAAVLQWLELEIEYIERMRTEGKPSEVQDFALTAIQAHLRDMSEQLTRTTFRVMDRIAE